MAADGGPGLKPESSGRGIALYALYIRLVDTPPGVLDAPGGYWLVHSGLQVEAHKNRGARFSRIAATPSRASASPKLIISALSDASKAGHAARSQ
jgi:hypothetical protein